MRSRTASHPRRAADDFFHAHAEGDGAENRQADWNHQIHERIGLLPSSALQCTMLRYCHVIFCIWTLHLPDTPRRDAALVMLAASSPLPSFAGSPYRCCACLLTRQDGPLPLPALPWHLRSAMSRDALTFNVVLKVMLLPSILASCVRKKALMYVQNMMKVEMLENHSGLMCFQSRVYISTCKLHRHFTRL